MLGKWFIKTGLWMTNLLGVSPLALWSRQLMPDVIDPTKTPPPGQMIDVGQYRLHLHSAGSGSPTVIHQNFLHNL